eukprot:729030-Pyramimonas_sp.AAC.2
MSATSTDPLATIGPPSNLKDPLTDRRWPLTDTPAIKSTAHSFAAHATRFPTCNYCPEARSHKTALQKPDNGARGIATGDVFRRL